MSNDAMLALEVAQLSSMLTRSGSVKWISVEQLAEILGSNRLPETERVPFGGKASCNVCGEMNYMIVHIRSGQFCGDCLCKADDVRKAKEQPNERTERKE